jgi:hypothetical protein
VGLCLYILLFKDQPALKVGITNSLDERLFALGANRFDRSRSYIVIAQEARIVRALERHIHTFHVRARKEVDPALPSGNTELYHLEELPRILRIVEHLRACYPEQNIEIRQGLSRAARSGVQNAISDSSGRLQDLGLSWAAGKTYAYYDLGGFRLLIKWLQGLRRDQVARIVGLERRGTCCLLIRRGYLESNPPGAEFRFCSQGRVMVAATSISQTDRESYSLVRWDVSLRGGLAESMGDRLRGRVESFLERLFPYEIDNAVLEHFSGTPLERDPLLLSHLDPSEQSIESISEKNSGVQKI